MPLPFVVRKTAEPENTAIALLAAARSCEAIVATCKEVNQYHPAIYHLESAARDLRKAYGLFA